MQNNGSFTTSNKLVYLFYLLQQKYLTGEELQSLIAEASVINRDNPARIYPHTAGLHANNVVNQFRNGKVEKL